VVEDGRDCTGGHVRGTGPSHRSRKIVSATDYESTRVVENFSPPSDAGRVQVRAGRL